MKKQKHGKTFKRITQHDNKNIEKHEKHGTTLENIETHRKTLKKHDTHEKDMQKHETNMEKH